MLESIQLPLFWLLLCLLSGALAALLIGRKTAKVNVVKYLNILAIATSLIILLIRGISMKMLPLLNGMDFSLWFIVFFLGIYLFFTKKEGWLFLGYVVFPIGIMLVIWMLQLDMRIYPAQPALRSIWLIFHVSAAVIAYASFAMSFVLSLMILLKDKGSIGDEGRVDRKAFDHVSYRLTMIGLSFLTIMLITGAVWAEYAWGSFWSWDPKETWALITWLIYSIYLHLRLRGWQGERAALINVIGFAAVVFTFFGVSYLLPGLHSYL